MRTRAINRILYIISVIVSLPTITGCREDDFAGKIVSADGDVPVVFNIFEPSQGIGTRGVEEYKQMFEEGDVIHVEGIFATATGATVTTYGAMRLESRKWVPVEESTIYWPYEAVSGTFKAYYVYNSNSLIPKGRSTQPVKLADIVDYQDPLEAMKADVPYGNAVNLRFTHACTYLTLEKLEPNVTDYYWMVFPGVNPIKNAYRLSLDAEGQLDLEFISVGDPEFNGQVYVSRKSENQYVNGKSFSQASFYLAPGDYSFFDLRTNHNYPFMSFSNSLKDPLLANHPYLLDVESAKGSNFVTTTQTEWDESNEAVSVDVSKFLDAVSKGNEYTEEVNGQETPILKMINGVLTLMKNIDFQFFDGYAELGFTPDVSNATIFDGNQHYIMNIGYPVFRFNFGTIQNLGLKNLDFEVTAYEGTSDNNYANDFSRIGGLCLWNRSEAVIKNVRIENFDISVKIHSEDPQIKQSNENYNIGALCGENWSNITGVALKGDFNISVEAEETTGEYSYVDANVNIGGIVGGHTMILRDVGPQQGETFSITITNLCKGRQNWGSGVFCIGGASGLSTGNEISQVVITNLDVRATESYGYQQYTGGIAGNIRGTDSKISDCTVQGSLTCGVVSPYGENAQHSLSYMGGIIGNAMSYTISNCRAVCSVTSNMNWNTESTYATGGAFGSLQSGCEIVNNSAYGTVLTGPANYIGTFVGIAPSGMDWASLVTKGNTARSVATLAPIGTNFDDTSSY